MNPLTLLKVGPVVLIAILVVALAVVTSLYMDKRDELIEFKATVAALGDYAQREKEALEKDHNDNLNTVRRQYETQAAIARDYALSAYRLRYPDPRSSTVPGTGSGIRLDDVSSEKRVATDGFIIDCGDDANKLTAWQTWAALNQIPVKE